MVWGSYHRNVICIARYVGVGGNWVIYSGVSRVGLKGVSKSRKFKWLVKVGACKDVNPLI